jgi:hypothetical protein
MPLCEDLNYSCHLPKAGVLLRYLTELNPSVVHQEHACQSLKWTFFQELSDDHFQFSITEILE